VSVAIPPDHGPRQILPAETYLARPWDALQLDAGKVSETALAYERMTAEQREAAVRAAIRIFEDPALRPLIEFLTDITLRRPTVLGLSPEALLLAHEREGANRIVWLIYAMIAEARGQMPPYREGT
jgi:hypothetical protein